MIILVRCPNCNNEVREARFCSQCGYSLENYSQNIVDNSNVNAPVDNHVINNNNLPSNTNNTVTMNNNTGLTSNNQYNNAYRPQNQKSKLIGIILNVIIPGLGYGYVGKWGEGIVIFVLYMIMWFLGLILILPLIIAFIIWIYSLVKTNEMIDRYNRGLTY